MIEGEGGRGRGGDGERGGWGEGGMGRKKNYSPCPHARRPCPLVPLSPTPPLLTPSPVSSARE
ncbi:MAG: hypothetical protein KME31_09185 [Tolypothrix carrinoi HA7290-LM1]|nr:hypothetical protein [Tolypothrix carrinoi HA7290-LM1]